MFYLKISEMHCPPSARHYSAPGYVDHEDRYGNIIPGDWRTKDNNPLQSVGQVSSNRYSRSAKELHDNLMDYFNSTDGTLSWQQNYIHSTGVIFIKL